MYEELRAQGWNQTEAINRIRRAYGNPSRSCVRRYLFPEDKEKQTKYSSKRWANLSPEQKAKYSAHKTEYRRVVRHLDEVLIEAFHLAAPQTALPLEEIAEYVRQASGVYVRPPTFLRASEKHAQQKGYSLLEQVPQNPIAYRLTSSQSGKQS